MSKPLAHNSFFCYSQINSTPCVILHVEGNIRQQYSQDYLNKGARQS